MSREARTVATGYGRSSRRGFVRGAAATGLLLARGWRNAFTQAPGGSATRPDVAAIDHDRIMTAAQRYITQPPTPLTSLPCPRSPGTAHDYYSEAELAPGAEAAAPGSAASAGGPAFTAHRDALFALGLQVPALAAAQLLSNDAKYAQHAATHLRGWFIDPATRMTPRLDFGQVQLNPPGRDHATISNNSSMGRVEPAARTGGTMAGILDTLPLVEVAQAIPFLAASGALTDADLSALHGWFAEYLHWLTAPRDSGPRLAALARDSRDLHGTSWLLQASAYSLLTAPANGAPAAEAKSMQELRHQFRTATLRAQISADGTFPRELPTLAPYRNSLFNLDMLAAICFLLSTRFESVWDYELEDGPSMRGAIAFHFPFIAERNKWPYRADSTHFSELPGRRISLLLAARAYQRPEYAALWKTLPPDPPSPEVLRTIPVHQPLLWVRQAPRVG